MKNMTKLAIASVGLFLFATHVTAASFDCHKASSVTEKAICGDKHLSQLDGEMGKAYKEASHHAGVKQEQRSWIKRRDKQCGGNEDCLYDMTKKRISALKHRTPKGSSSTNNHATVDFMQAARECKTYLADKFPDFPNAAFSVNGNGARVKNGLVLVPVDFKWDKPFVEERGECILKNGIVKRYHRTSN